MFGITRPVFKPVKTYFKKLVGFIVTIFLCFLISVFVPPISLIQCLIIIWAKHFRPDLGKCLTTRSAVFATDDLYGKPKANIVITLVFNGDVLAEFKRDFVDGAVKARNSADELVNPELQQSVSSLLGFSFWKWDKEFSSDNHFKKWDGPLDIPVLTQPLVNGLCSEYLRTPFVRGRSPWKVILFPKCQLQMDRDQQQSSPDYSSCAAILRLHHTLADGASIVKLLLSILPEQGVQFTAQSISPLDQLASVQSKMGFTKFIKRGFSVLKFLSQAPFEFVNSWLFAYDSNEYHLSEEQLSPNTAVVFSERIPMTLIQDIKNVYGVGFTAVISAAFAGAVRSFMIENGFKVPESMHALMPFPVPGHQHPNKLRNFMTDSYFRLPTGLPTPEERFEATDKYIQNFKKSTRSIAMFYVLALIGILPTLLPKVFFYQRGPTALIFVFPGPQKKIKYLGRPLEDMMFALGLHPGRIGIGFTALSYAGNVRIEIAMNETIVTTPIWRTRLLEKFTNELLLLAEKQISRL